MGVLFQLTAVLPIINKIVVTTQKRPKQILQCCFETFLKPSFPNFLTSKLQWDFVHEPPRLQSTLAEMQNDSHDHLPRGPVPGLPGPLDSMHDDPPMPLPRVNIDSVCCLFLQNEIMFQLKMEMVIEKEGSLPA